MAIKGKSRRRSRARRTAVPPRPQIGARKLHLLQQPGLRRAIVSALGLAVILGGLRVWQNTARADDLRSYDRALTRAQGLLLQHLSPDSPTYLEKNVSDFTSKRLGTTQFSELGKAWENDFRSTLQAVRRLRPPSQLRQAQEQLAEGIDAYVGVARLYQLAALQRSSGDGVTDKKVSQKIENQVQVILQHAREWRERADKIYSLGQSAINSYKASWHIEAPLPPPGPPQIPQIPGG